MPKSNLDLFNRSLEIIGAKAAGQPASAEDMALVKAALKPLTEELSSIDVAFIYTSATDDAAEEIEDKVFHPLANLLADEIAPSFGVARADAATRKMMENRLRQVFALGPQYLPQPAEYF